MIHTGREGLDPSKTRYAQATDARSLGDVMPGADIFMGLSSAGVLKPEMVKSMAAQPIILAMAIAALLAITLDPALRMLFTRMDFPTWRPRPLSWLVGQVTVGRYYPEERHPVSRILFALYEPACRLVLRFPKATIALAVAGASAR